jgi:hypothetical protein
MMVRSATLAVLLLLTVGKQIAAQTVMGAGTVSCGEWLRVRSVENSPGNVTERATRYQLTAWIDGYLSGANVANGGQIADFLISTPDGPGMTAFVDNYCRSKPLDPVMLAAQALMRELQSRARR